ncbi:filamentous hemagglutinin N-terminal domain-containing protein [Pseudomonas sp. CVAP|uniref:filamentous hemagglutinin N-terminal domain-containing protein n=1 Tax=Pseudomonas sp. CVAP\|nr:filamentous hemagglutinin N-terminal domain-containing protein [Pseudomonas sp. CVAP\
MKTMIEHPAQLGRVPSRRTKLALALMLTLPVVQQTASAQPLITVDPSAAQPAVVSTVNGTPVINIVAPNSSGVSHNKFTDFNVGPTGLILNNSTVGTQTTLAGAVTGNNLLNGKSAGIILNEVTGQTASRLNGAIEVAGPSARVVIANPNGISTNGASFINANRVSLVAGKVVFDDSGNLSRFQTDKGQIRVEGAGLKATEANEVDLIARTLQVNAVIQAKKLNATALKGEVYAVNPAMVAKVDATADNQPEVAIDVAQLGGMHADSIRLVGKSAGVGVNVDGKINALTGGLSVTSDGKVMIASTGELDAKQLLSINGGMNNHGVAKGASVSITGDSVQSGKASLLAGGSLSVTGGMRNDGEVKSGNSMTYTGTVVNNGTLRSGGSMTYTGSLENHGTARSTGSMTINSPEVFNDNVIHSDSKLTLLADDVKNTQTGSITSAGSFSELVDTKHNQGVMGSGFKEPPAKPSVPVAPKPEVTPPAVVDNSQSQGAGNIAGAGSVGTGGDTSVSQPETAGTGVPVVPKPEVTPPAVVDNSESQGTGNVAGGVSVGSSGSGIFIGQQSGNDWLGSGIAGNQVGSDAWLQSVFPSWSYVPGMWQTPVVTYPAYKAATWKQPSYKFTLVRNW